MAVGAGADLASIHGRARPCPSSICPSSTTAPRPPRDSATICARRRTTWGSSTSPARASPPSSSSACTEAARDFFALPEADKLAIENVNSPHFRGYTRVGGERTQGKVDWREQIDIGPERDAVDDPDAPDFTRLTGPNLWPAAQPELREVVTEWHDHLSGVARKLLRAWALSLGAPESYFDEHFGEPSTLIKIVRYPGTDDPEPAAGRRRAQGLRCAHAALGRARQGRSAGASATASGSTPPPCPAPSSSTSASCSSTRRRAT